MKWVGQSIPRSEDRVLAQGCGQFTADMNAGALHLRLVRSPLARGRLLGIEAPAGARVVTASDLEGVKPIRPLLHRKDYVAVDHPILASGAVHFVGQPVAAVLAGSAAEAEDIAEQVFLDIEPEDAVVDLDQALAVGGTPVHPQAPGNVLVEGRHETPGFAEVAKAAAHTVEIVLRSRRQNALPLETRGGLAAFERRTGRVVLTCSTQMPHLTRTGISDCLGMREADLRVVAPDVGGGFGQKMCLPPEYVLLVWAARAHRCAVAWTEDRRENLIASFHSRDQAYRLRAGFAGDGRLLALEGDLACNVGAFSCYPVTCGVEPLMALAELPGPYDIQAYKVRARAVASNTCPMAPYRGVSRPVLTFAMERLMDVAARRLGLDPLAIRRRNLITEFPYRTATGITYDEGSYVASMEKAAKLVDVAAFRARQAEARRHGRMTGLGFSVCNERSGYGTPAFAARSMDITPGFETVEICMNPSGEVEARIGASPHGQGLATALSQILADELGMAPSDVRVIHGDTDQTPYGWGTFASRSMVISGGACKLAGRALAGKLRLIAARLLQSTEDQVTLADGFARTIGGGGIEIARLARLAWHQSHHFKEDVENGLRATATYDPGGTYSNACHAAIVTVDLETCAVSIDRYLVVEDAGIIVNPTIAEGQVRGGVAQGIANALYEEIVYDEAGNPLTASLADYLPPTLMEVPPIEIAHLETPTDATLTGAKGLGEGGAIGAPAAVINAIADALAPLGVEPLEMPVTPSRLHALIAAAREGRR